MNAMTLGAVVLFAAGTLGQHATLVPPAAHFSAGLTQSSEGEEILVSAAISLTEALQEICRKYEAKTKTKVTLNLGGSNRLARQIIAGAPADLFISADQTQMNEVERAGRLDGSTRIDLLSNELIVVVPDDSRIPIQSVRDLLSPAVRKVAVADPDAVPAGIYARQYLERMKVWEPLQPRLIRAGDVRAALAAVEAGNVDAAFVYRTDLNAAHGARLAFTVPRAETSAIVYPAAVIRGSRHAQAARGFLDYLRGPIAGEVFKAKGFIVLGASGGAASRGANAASPVPPRARRETVQ